MDGITKLACVSLLAAVVALTGCDEVSQVGARIKLVGTWQADLTEANVGTFGVNTNNNSNPLKAVFNSIIKDTANTFASSVDAKETLELDHKGTFKVTMAVQGKELSSATGTWKVLSSSGDAITLSMKYANKAEAQEVGISLQEKDQITLPPMLSVTTSGKAIYRRVE